MSTRKKRSGIRGSEEASPSLEQDPVPVIALGASAGGLKALEVFCRAVPPESKMAYVLAMHLSPEYESQLARILQAFTFMPVTQVSAAIEIEPDHIYIISPGQSLSVQGNHLHVSPRDHSSSTGVIDHLFRSLAEDRQEMAVGIVFSGSGNDGTLGLQAIHEYGGFILVQDPNEAEFDAMPRSVIATGIADFILNAAEMPAQLLALRDRHPRLILPARQKTVTSDDEQAIRDILKCLREETGYDLSHYKNTTLLRQVGRRMQVLHLDNLSAYTNRLKEDEEEVRLLFRNLLVSVTRFFRNPEAYETLAQEVLPKLYQEARIGDDGEPAQLRVWVPGCATGEEAYSLAMLLAEHQEETGMQLPVQLIATDIDEAALDIARRGSFPEAAVADLSPARLQRFFIQTEGSFRVTDELRASVLFATHDVTRDPPFARLDLLSCRNLLIYFKPEMQRQVFERFAYSLRSGGYLFLGTVEGVGRVSPLFTNVSKKHGLFQRSAIARTSSQHISTPFTRAFPVVKRLDSGDSALTQSDATVPIHTEIPALKETADVELSNEALILANQDMQSLNEELRSMMEEIEVAKEEMQSLNEELTMVNQELQNKIEEHRRTNNDLHLLIESTHMATLFLDQHLNVGLYTPESTKLFNLLPVDIGRPLEHLSHRLTYTGVLQDARQVLEHRTEVNREVRAQDGSWYSMRVMPYMLNNGPAVGVVLTFADITSQKKVEQVSAERFTLTFHAGPTAASIVRCDDSTFLDVNEHFEQITGYRREQVVGQPARSFGMFFGDELEPVARKGPGGQLPDEIETRILTRSGTLRDVVVSITAIDFGGYPCYLNLFYDVTERKRLEREILLVSDREQRKIGVDLHDGLGTHLTGLAMMVRGLARNIRAGRSVSAEEMDEIAGLLGNGIEQARMLAQGLNPFLLEVRGLSIALKELAANHETQTGIDCSFKEEGDGMALNAEQSMHIYRITQEALTNATRHAQATRIQITLTRRDHHYRLMIRDDGKGFNPDRGEESGERLSGMGLSIMRYRAELIGARLTVASTPGTGTTITCSLRVGT